MAWLRFASLLAFGMLASPRTDAADEYVVYRCTDARGKVQLRDSPCPAGQRQTVRRMQRIVDPPAKPEPQPVAATPALTTAAAPQVVLVQPPRPMYECTTPDGQRYLSQTPEGNPRWMPLWVLGVPVLAEQTMHTPGQVHIARDQHGSHVRIDTGSIDRRVVPTIAAYGNAGTWVRDVCNALPQHETCARLSDRRDELNRLAFNAQPSERERLELEERSIKAQLRADCR